MGATGVATMPRLVSSLNLTGHAKLIATPPRRWSAQSIMTNSPPPPPTSLPPNGPLGEFPAQQSLKGVGPNADGRCRAGWLLEASGPWVSRDPPRETRGGTQTRTLRGWFLAPSPFPLHMTTAPSFPPHAPFVPYRRRKSPLRNTAVPRRSPRATPAPIPIVCRR